MIRQAALALAVSAGFVVAGPAQAFDTGPHATITEDAMAIAGYNSSAANAAQVENWLTDYYTSSPTFRGDQCALEKLHFDDVFTGADVDAYWNTLLRNTLAAAAKAKADNNFVELYTVIGISLHVVQDFYAHSNWVESSGYDGPSFDTTTYFQWRQSPWQRTDVVHTGWYSNCLDIPQDGHAPHGGYAGPGMNHDSVVRPRYNRAYVYALAASVEWLEQIRRAVDVAPVGDPHFLANAMTTYSPLNGQTLWADQQASLYISEWIENPLNAASLDGHWNGNHSGYALALAPFLVGWTKAPDSDFVRAFNTNGVYAALNQGLYAPFTGEKPAVYPAPLSGTVIDMHTARVWANRDLTGTSSYFGSIRPTFAGQNHAAAMGYPIRDAAQIHRPRTDVPWEYLAFTPAWSPSVTLSYTVSDETGLPSPSVTAVPINGASTVVNFVCNARPASHCVWSSPGGGLRPMPDSLELKGDGSDGVALSGISIHVVAAGPWRPN